jgi:hypothetical protein
MSLLRCARNVLPRNRVKPKPALGIGGAGGTGLGVTPRLHTLTSFGTTYANPEGDYETALNSIAEERQALEARILAKEQERAQWQQRLDRRCFGAEASP